MYRVAIIVQRICIGFLAALAVAKPHHRHGHRHRHHGTPPRTPKHKQPGPGRPVPPRPRKNCMLCQCAWMHASAWKINACMRMIFYSTSSWRKLHHKLPSAKRQVSAHHMRRRRQLHSSAVHWWAPRDVLLRKHHHGAQAERDAPQCSSEGEGYDKLHWRWADSVCHTSST